MTEHCHFDSPHAEPTKLLYLESQAGRGNFSKGFGARAERQWVYFSTKRTGYVPNLMALALLSAIIPMENDLNPLRMLTLDEAAELLNVSKRTLLRMIQRSQFPALKIGGQWRVRESQLEKWIQDLDEL